MEDAGQPSLEDLRVVRCPRCLQPVPPKATACPDCRLPIQRLRILPWAMGAAGLLMLMFALLVLFRMMHTETHLKEPVPVEQTNDNPDKNLFPEPAADDKNPKTPPKPEKRPPLDER